MSETNDPPSSPDVLRRCGEVLKLLSARWDAFRKSDGNQGDAYYTLAKGHYEMWAEVQALSQLCERASAGEVERLRGEVERLRADNDVRMAVYRGTRTRATTAEARLAEMEGVLRKLEAANDHLCSLRTQEQYLAMIDDGQKDALERLDEARSAARALLATIDKGEG